MVWILTSIVVWILTSIVVWILTSIVTFLKTWFKVHNLESSFLSKLLFVCFFHEIIWTLSEVKLLHNFQSVVSDLWPVCFITLLCSFPHYCHKFSLGRNCLGDTSKLSCYHCFLVIDVVLGVVWDVAKCS